MCNCARNPTGTSPPSRNPKAFAQPCSARPHGWRIAEALQERERFTRRPLRIETWTAIARGDTGGIFDLAMAAGGIEPATFWPGRAIAYLRHGLDDVDDILDEHGDQADVRDRVPT